MHRKLFNKTNLFTYLTAAIIVFALASFILALTTRTYVFRGEKYFEKEEVALHILKYDGELPANYITKGKAERMYPNLSKTVYNKVIKEGYSIGGDKFEPLGEILSHTSAENLKECDIYSFENKKMSDEDTRGPQRLVYTGDGNEVFYTSDHYASFERLTKWNINGASNIFWIIFTCLCLGGAAYLFVAYRKKQTEEITLVKEASLKTAIATAILVALPFVLIYMIARTVVNCFVKKPKNEDF